MKKSVLITVFVVLAASVNIYAQDDSDAAHSISINIPEVALLDLEGGSSITLTPDVPTEAGEAFDFSAATDNSIWVNYSSIVASGNSRNYFRHRANRPASESCCKRIFRQWRRHYGERRQPAYSFRDSTKPGDRYWKLLYGQWRKQRAPVDLPC